MNIDSIERGVVIDHIDAGKGMELVRLLHLDKLTCPVAVIRNARSSKTGKKDIIKIEDEIDLDFDVLGFIDPSITVNIIVNGHIVEKKRIAPPHRVVNVVQCKNPRCITSVERELPQIFRRADESSVYRCAYCEQEYQQPE
ncbi:aspartate carbamoyltransferase regulatory subunit [Ruminococcaceae bacterium OttesenSCG-928-A16]|nr:aspartate carbamoyltransferase regulatory subunit [Ruminococcaceae bacterium OttesenSCG-928-A16]